MKLPASRAHEPTKQKNATQRSRKSEYALLFSVNDPRVIDNLYLSIFQSFSYLLSRPFSSSPSGNLWRETMEFVQELFLTAFAAVVFSFVVAKVVSMAVGGDGERELGLKSNEGACGEGERVVDELKFGGGLRVQSVESAKNFQFVEESVEMVDEFGRERLVDKSEDLLCCEEFEEKRCGTSGWIEAGEVSEKSSGGRSPEKDRVAEIVGGTKVDGIKKEHAVTNLGELVVEGGSERTEEDEIEGVGEGSEMTGLVVEEKIVENAEDNSKIVDEDAEIRDVESGENRGSGIERGLNKGDEMKGSLVSDEDDDWEGIEKSELAETFARAANFVSGRADDDRLLNVGNDVQMQLYALHKVAMEGPCYEPQPMALKVSARAKWYETFLQTLLNYWNGLLLLIDLISPCLSFFLGQIKFAEVNQM